jgi:hypothetical protein
LLETKSVRDVLGDLFLMGLALVTLLGTAGLSRPR